ncbi:helix-turn-helix domain-containing protein [Streptomyces apocyni]|uniref:helix-turn-helix domain-containing protein n=1 Tax=Streptomyces apocyni TaxID=2654677 RepID=UPI0012EA023D|nr:pyridoxamine 5'-phosphate oxidase family protein [Streptomyces apocyni]
MPRTTPKPTARAVGHTDLGRRIAARRVELGYTREQLAQRCGMDVSYLAYLEERAAHPSTGTLVRLAGELGTTIAELTGVTTDRPPGRGTAWLESELVKLSETECRRLLSTHGIGRVAIVSPDGPGIFPVNYVVAGNEIAFRTEGDALLARAAGTQVAFEVDHIDDVMKTGWSVLVVGAVEGVTDAEALRRLDAVARSLPWAGGDRTYWMSITPVRITGRRAVPQ